MKKVVFISLFLLSISASAQQYRKFLFAFDFGSPLAMAETPQSALPIGSFSLEPGYRIRNNVLVGFRMEEIGIFQTIGATNDILGSYGINGQYYFTKTRVRPFAGLGIGLYNVNYEESEHPSQKNGLGFYPRIGMELGHMRIMLEYNLIQTMRYWQSYDNPFMSSHYENINQSYLSLKIGVFVGGGKKKIK